MVSSIFSELFDEELFKDIQETESKLQEKEENSIDYSTASNDEIEKQMQADKQSIDDVTKDADEEARQVNEELERFQLEVEECKKKVQQLGQLDRQKVGDNLALDNRLFTQEEEFRFDLQYEAFTKALTSTAHEMKIEKERLDAALSSLKAESDRQFADVINAKLLGDKHIEELSKEDDKEASKIMDFLTRKNMEFKSRSSHFVESSISNVRLKYRELKATIKEKANIISEFSKDVAICAKEAVQKGLNAFDQSRINHYKRLAAIDDFTINFHRGVIKTMRNVGAKVRACTNILKSKTDNERATAYADGLNKANENALKRYEALTKNLTKNLATYTLEIEKLEKRQFEREVNFSMWDTSHTRSDLTDPKRPDVIEAVAWGANILAKDEQKKSDFLEIYNRTLLDDKNNPSLDARQIAEIAKMLKSNIPTDLVSEIAKSDIPAMNMTALRKYAEKDAQFITSKDNIVSLGTALTIETATKHYKEISDQVAERIDVNDFVNKAYVINKIEMVGTELSPMSAEQISDCTKNVSAELEALYGIPAFETIEKAVAEDGLTTEDKTLENPDEMEL